MGRFFEFLKISNLSMIFFLTCISLIIYIDRGVLSSIITTLEKPKDVGLNLSDKEIGLLGSIFMVGYMTSGPIFAYYSQIIQPLYLIAIGLTVWGFSSLVSGMSSEFWMLLTARAFSGIGEASFVCLAPPFILDHASQGKKTLALAFFYSTIALGNAIGLILGNFINKALNGWFWPFYFEAVLIIPFVVLCVIAKKDENMLATRKNSKENEGQVDNIGTQLKKLSKNLVFVFIVLGFTAFIFSLGALSYWAPTIVEKQYSKSSTTANITIGLICVCSGLVGTLSGSLFLDLIVKKQTEKLKNPKETLIKNIYTQSSCLFLSLTTFCAILTATIGAVLNTYESFLIGISLGVFFIFL